MLRAQLQEIITQAVDSACAKGDLPFAFDINIKSQIEIILPDRKQRGDFCSPIALKLTSGVGDSLKVAQAIAQQIEAPGFLIEKVEVSSPGYLNFHLSASAFASVIQYILKIENHHNLGNWGDPATTLSHKDNPEFLVDYVRRRLSVVLKQLQEPLFNLSEQRLEPSLIKEDMWSALLDSYANDIGALISAFDESVVGKALFLDHRFLALLLDNSLTERLESPKLKLAAFLDKSHVLEGLYIDSHISRRARIGLIHAAKRVLDDSEGILNMTV